MGYTEDVHAKPTGPDRRSSGDTSRPAFRRSAADEEYFTPEGCWILERWNSEADPAVSIARARVEPGVTTRLHRLHGVIERYVILSGTGLARIGTMEPVRVEPGDIVVIPAEVAQQITNDGAGNLVFLCVCTPRFTIACYEDLGPGVAASAG